MSQSFAAVDLGASSGRVMLAHVGDHGIELHEVHRFTNRPVTVVGTLYWDLLSLWGGAIDGLRIAAQRTGRVAGIAVDSWAVDYALIDPDGLLLGNAVHYRDRRTDGVAAALSEVMSPERLYARDGLQPLPFNTVFQFAAARDTWAMRHAAHALLIPDLFGYWLTGELASEQTNASTTGLLDPRSGQWDSGLFAALGLRHDLFPPVRPPGTVLGPLQADVAADCGIDEAVVSLVGSHDTASAVAGVPAGHENFAYISCGTWSLVGVEIAKPVTTEAARAAGFSNELGVDGTVRFLRNVMGLWLLQECVRAWQRHGDLIDLPRLLAEAEQVPGGRTVIDPDRPEFLPPGDMPERLRAECRRTGQPVPETPAEITRCILDSLADAYRRTVRQAAELSGVQVDIIHLVGGGAQNSLLCQLAADACELPVAAGPVEAAAYGNVLVQARTAGVLTGDLAEMRRLLHSTSTYVPRLRRGVFARGQA
jgi:sugar (pentulose or hexulose) kinase